MDWRARREATVREHMESENRHEFDVTMATFDHPRYEIIATGEIYDGEQEVAEYFRITRTAFPDQRNELIALHHGDDCVAAEFDLRGTHQGELRGILPTGREFTCRCLALFLFEEDRLVCERVYFDVLTIMGQLGLTSRSG
jgi:predicted ester cyclase